MDEQINPANGSNNLGNLPDRTIAEQNSAWRAGDGIEEESLRDLPDRQIADKNSAYNNAKRAGEKWGEAYRKNDEQSNPEAIDQMSQGGQTYSEQAAHFGSDRQHNAAGQGQSVYQNQAGGQGQPVHQNQAGGQGQSGGQGQIDQIQQTYQDPLNPGLQKENTIRETVSLDTDPYEGPSKLDNL